MKIVHICLEGIVTDGLSYQDNLLPKYQARMGHQIIMITSNWIYNKKGELVRTSNLDYVNDDNVHIIRLCDKNNKKFHCKFKKFPKLCEILSKEEPDILFIHGINSYSNLDIVKYLKKHNNIRVYVDNHCDYSNSATNLISKYLLHRTIWRYVAKKLKPYTRKFFGVLPNRVDFIVENYKIPRSRCDLLVMGADDEIIKKVNSKEVKRKIRKKFSIDEDDFLIVTGGKIDVSKKQTLLLMKAIHHMNNKKIKLLIFGSVVAEIKENFDKLCESENIQYIGWASNMEASSYFSVADLVVFPGRHSVYWEETVALGIPMVCKYWDGVNHIDIGGNVKFIHNDTVTEIESILREITENKEIYIKMKQIANSEKKNIFLYSAIARKSISD